VKNRILFISLAVVLALSVGLIGCGREEVPEYNLTISSTEGGSVTTPGEGTSTYDEGTDVDLVAVADEGYVFEEWVGDVGTIANVGDATTTITMNDNYSITATFRAEQIRIGGIFDVTGELAAMGDLIAQGAILAVEEINADGGVLGTELVLVIEDGATSADTGFNAYKKLVEVNEVRVIVGPMLSVAVMSSGAYAQDMQVPMVSPSSTSALVHIQPWTDWAFRTCAADHAQATVLAQIITEEGYQTAAILVVDDMYMGGIGFELLVTEILKAADVEIVASARCEPGQPDYLTELNAIKDTNPDVIVQVGYHTDSAALIFEQAAAVGLDTIPWLVAEGAYGLDAETYPAAAAFMAGTNLLGCTLVPEEVVVPEYTAFVERYEARWGESPGIYCDTVYDAVKLIALAIEKAGVYDGKAIKEALYEVGVDYAGASGTITWDEKGDRVGLTYGIWKLVYDEEKDEYEYVILYNVEF